MQEEHRYYEFNYASISIIPYSNDSGTSSKLLKDIFRKLAEPSFPDSEKLKDRNEKQKGSIKRRLIILANRFDDAGARYFGKIALIKNKSPLLLSGKDIIEEIEKVANKEFIEVTNFAIHFNKNSDPVIMHEYNHEGPRLSDIIYYIRQIAMKYKIGKNLDYSLHLNTKYEQLDSKISNVFNVKVKINSRNNNQFNWFKSLKNLKDDSGYRDIKMEIFYKRKKDSNGKYPINIDGTKFARNIIGWLKKDSKNIEYIDDLKMEYQLDGSDEIIDLDFLKNKVISVLKLKPIEIKYNNTFKLIIGQEFNKYLTTFTTTIEEE